jgi:hypothetical protein
MNLFEQKRIVNQIYYLDMILIINNFLISRIYCFKLFLIIIF